VLHGNGDGTLGGLQEFDTHQKQGYELSLADLNGDGSPDIISDDNQRFYQRTSEPDVGQRDALERGRGRIADRHEADRGHLHGRFKLQEIEIKVRQGERIGREISKQSCAAGWKNGCWEKDWRVSVRAHPPGSRPYNTGSYNEVVRHSCKRVRVTADENSADYCCVSFVRPGWCRDCRVRVHSRFRFRGGADEISPASTGR
jgi:hypothetical protein